MKIEKVSIDKLLLDPANARKHSKKNLDSIKGSLAKFGQQKPIVVNAENVVVAGNGTLQAAKELGWKEINIVRTDLKGSDITAFGIADNRTSELAEWDDDVLKELLEGLKAEDFDLSAIGFDDDEFAEMMGGKSNEGLTDPDAVPEVPEEPKTKLGDIYRLGNHRLMCGDSTDKATVEKLMDGKKAEMVFTDPPYGVDYTGQVSSMNYGGSKGKSREKILNDKDTKSIIEFMPILATCCDGVAYVFCGAGKELDLLQAIKNNKYELINTLIWNKPKGTLALGANYKPCFEMFYYFKVCGSRRWSGNHAEWTVWDVEYKKDNTLHPTQKPVSLIEKALNNHNCKYILDLFGGSGSTLIACEKTGRNCFIMELDPKYCDVIIKRWEDFTGKKAELLSS